MEAKQYSTEFKSPIVALHNEGHSANSLANECHLAVKPSRVGSKGLRSL
ncbi:hypothetical protein [Leuconostoc mesenteroides]|nr:hypothetical protein [Leuconostoc mesenteroides]